MKGPVERIPILDVKLTFVELLEASQKKHDINMVHLCVSVLEYMKDAQRWHYAERHTLPKKATPRELREYVDAELNK